MTEAKPKKNNGSTEGVSFGQKKRRKKDHPSKLSNTATIIASAVIILAGIHATRAILAPIFIAAFFALLLVLVLNFLEKKMGFSSSFSLLTLILLVVLIGFGTASILSVQLAQFKNDIPHYRDNLNKILLNFNLSFDDFRHILPFESNAPEKETGKRIAPSESFISNSENQSLSRGHIVPVSAEISSTEIDSEQNPIPSIFDDPPKNDTFLPQDDLSQPEVALGRDLTTEEIENQEQIDQEEESEETNSKTNESGGYSAEQFGISSSAAVESSSNALFGFLIQFSGGMMLFASYTFMITLLVIFMLVEASQLEDKVKIILSGRPGKKNKNNNNKDQNGEENTSKKEATINKVIDDIRRYMLIKTLMSIMVGISVTILLFLTHVRYPVLWGIIALLLNFIPNIGSVVAAIPPIILATVDVSLPCGIIVTIFMILINCVVGYIVEPRFLGKGLNLSPLVVLFSLLFSGWLLGPVGMFLSPPLAVICKIILYSYPETRWIATLMANSVERKDALPEPKTTDISPERS